MKNIPTEQALLEVTERLNLALYAASMGTWSWDIDSVEASIWDEHMWVLFGLPVRGQPTLMSHEDFLACIYADDQESVRQEVFNRVKDKQSYHIEYRIVWPDGSLHWLAERGKLYCNEAGQPARVTGVCWDISERKQYERDLLEMSERFNLALEAGKVGTWYWDVGSDEAIWDKYTAALMGFETNQEMRTNHAGFIACIHPDDRDLETVKRESVNALPVDRPFYFEYRVMWPDGSVRTIAERGKLYRDAQGQPLRVTGICQDITEQMEAKAHVKELNERLSMALDAASVGTWSWDITHDKIHWDTHMKELFALKEEVYEGSFTDFLEYVHPDDRNFVKVKTQRVIKGKERNLEFEHRIIWPDNSIHVIASHGKLYRDETGLAVRMSGASCDVTERRQAEHALEEVSERLNLALRAASMGTWSWSIEEDVVHWDNYMYPLYGLKPGSFNGGYEAAIACIYPEDQEYVRQEISKAIHENMSFDIEHRVQWPDGSLHFIAARGKVYRNEKDEAVRLTGVSWDITPRKQTEQTGRQHQIELAHVARMNSMGEMASTLAHELNQPLAAIANYTKGCVRRLESGHFQLEQIMNAMRQAAFQSERAGEIIHRMKNFVRKGKLYYEAADINKIIRNMVQLISYEMREFPIPIHLELAEQIPHLPVDTIQIEQVILNLLRNAIEAMQEVKTVKPRLIVRTLMPSGDIMHVDVIDNGPGFTAEVAQCLLTPYFTTKPKGMGMGLAICRTIVEAHGGHLSARLNPEGGAWFQFTLPVTNIEIV